jgi:hypothetical protein
MKYVIIALVWLLFGVVVAFGVGFGIGFAAGASFAGLVVTLALMVRREQIATIQSGGPDPRNEVIKEKMEQQPFFYIPEGVVEELKRLCVDGRTRLPDSVFGEMVNTVKVAINSLPEQRAGAMAAPMVDTIKSNLILPMRNYMALDSEQQEGEAKARIEDLKKTRSIIGDARVFTSHFEPYPIDDAVLSYTEALQTMPAVLPAAQRSALGLKDLHIGGHVRIEHSIWKVNSLEHFEQQEDGESWEWDGVSLCRLDDDTRRWLSWETEDGHTALSIQDGDELSLETVGLTLEAFNQMYSRKQGVITWKSKQYTLDDSGKADRTVMDGQKETRETVRFADFLGSDGMLSAEAEVDGPWVRIYPMRTIPVTDMEVLN